MITIGVTKTFYPVGQGGFYSERIFCDGTLCEFVYDCGAVNKGESKKAFQERMDSVIGNSGISQVDFLVISHLDEDHINGILNLKKYLEGQGDGTLFILPDPTPLDLLLFFERASEVSIDWFLNEKRLLKISKGEKFENSDAVILNADLAGKTYSHKQLFSVNRELCWRIKFYVDSSKYENRLSVEDVELIHSVKTFDDFKSRRKELKNVYKKVYRGVNGSSMAMISFPMVGKKIGDGGQDCFMTWMNGDICLKTRKELSDIEKHFKEIEYANCDFQIPHHGSHHNLKVLPKIFRKMRTYINAGKDNKYGHPSGTILKMNDLEGIECRWITEEDKSVIQHEWWTF